MTSPRAYAQPSIYDDPKLIEKVTIEVVYRDGSKEIVSLQSTERSQVHGKGIDIDMVERYPARVDVTDFNSPIRGLDEGVRLRVELRGGEGTYTREPSP
jgi:hypothetical protein